MPKHVDLFSLPQVAEFTAPVRLDFRSRKHDRPFNFGYAKALGEFALLVVKAFKLHIERVETRSVNALEVSYRRFLFACLDFQLISGGLHSGLNLQLHQRMEHWLDRWAAGVRQSDLEDGTANSYISSVRVGAELLIDSGAMLPIRLPEGRRYAKVSYHKNITRLHQNTGAASILKDAPVHIKEIFRELSFLKKFPNDKSISEYIDVTITHLRKKAEASARHFWRIFQLTQDAIASNVFDVAAFHAKYRIGERWAYGFGRVLSNELNLLSYATHQWGGVIDTVAMDKATRRLVYKEHDLRELRAKLHLVPEACVPFIVIILCETIMNVESCGNLKTSCLRSTLDPAEMSLSWEKGRAGSRALETPVLSGVAHFLPRDETTLITVPQAIRCLLEMRKSLVQYADAGEEDALFLVWLASNARGAPRKHRHVRQLSIANLDISFREWLSADPVLHTLGLRLSMIRGSLAIKEYIDSGGDILRVQQLLDHVSVGTTIRYIEDSLVEISSDEDTRRVLEFIQVGVVKNQQSLQDAVGLTDQGIAEILDGARNIGFLAWTSRQSDSQARSDVRLSPMYQWLIGADIVVIETPEMAAELLALRDHLHDQKRHYHHQQTWVRRWAFLLVATEMALDRFSKDIVKAGEKIRDDLGIAYLEVR